MSSTTMTYDERQELVDWLRENARYDVPLLELVDALDHAGRDDLLRLVRDFRVPPELDDDELERRAGSARELEILLHELHQAFFRPIFDRHRKRETRETLPRMVYARLGKTWTREYAESLLDAGKPSDRQDLDRIIHAAYATPRVRFEDLPELLGESLDVVRDLLLELDSRHKQRLRRSEGGPSKRSLS